MKHFNFFKRRVCSLATLLAMFAVFCSSLQAQQTHNISSSPLTIKKGDGDYIITGSTEENYVVIESGYNGTVTLKDVSIVLKDPMGMTPPIRVKGKFNGDNYNPVTNVNIILEGANELIFHGMMAATFQVDQGAQINISSIDPMDNSSGSLFAQSSVFEPGSTDEQMISGAAIGAPFAESQGWAELYTKDPNDENKLIPYTVKTGNKSPDDDTYETAGGNIIISSGTITAHGGHGAGIGGGYLTWYDGVIIVTGGDVTARAGRHAAGLGSGCPLGNGIETPFTAKSAIIALPPCRITAFGAYEANQDPDLALAGARFITYVNDPAKPVITIRTDGNSVSEYEKNADIYLDLTETAGLKAVFDQVHPTFDLTHVWIGKTGASDGLMKVNGEFREPTTFFTNVSSTNPATFGRPYMPVTKTTSGAETIVLPLFAADIVFTDYPSTPLVEGYTTTEAETNAFCLKVEYNDSKSFTNLTYDIAGDPTHFDKLIFLESDSLTPMLNQPTTLTQGQKFYIVAPLKQGRMAGAYSDVILVKGVYDSKPMSGYIRRISDQLVVKDDTETNKYIKVTADLTSFMTDYPTDTVVNLTLNIAAVGERPYDPAKVTAKYIITTEQNYDAAVNQTPVNQWEDMIIPQTEKTNTVTAVSFKDMMPGTYYIHWYVVSDIVMAHSKDVTNPVRQYGGFGKYEIYEGRTITYDGNTHDNGSVPVDNTKYPIGANATVAGNTGLLAKTGATFIGWSFGQTNLITAKADEPSDLMNANDQFVMTIDTTLYAVWAIDATGPGGGSDSIPDYMQLSVVYNGNGHTGGTPPVDASAYNNGDDVTVKAHGDLVRADAVFIGWSFGQTNLITAKADEPTDLMAANDLFKITADTTLYAVWAIDATGPGGGSDSIPDYMQLSVVYNGNGHTGGTAPVDASAYNNGDDVTVKAHGDLVRADAVFIGWSFGQTNLITAKADEPTDLMAANDLFKITADTTLYAVWAIDATGPGGGSDSIPDYMQLSVVYNGNGHTGGTAPVDANAYNNGDDVTVKAHGDLVRTDATFIGWSFGPTNLITAKADEPSDLMAANDQFVISNATTLYAVWAVDATGPGGGSDSIPDYNQLAVTYNGNGHTGGTVPVDGSLYNNGDNVTVKAHGDLVRTDAMFIGWSFGPTNLITAKADEPSDLMAANDQFAINKATTLFAVWAVDATGPGGGSDSIPDYDQLAVTYNGNGHTGGTVPADGSLYNNGDNVTVKAHGDLVRTDAMFIGWSFGPTNLITAKADEPADLMAANDLFKITADTTLFAVWAIDATGPGGGSDSIPDYMQLTVTYNGNNFTGGVVPTDANAYNNGDDVTVKAHGNLVRTDAMFIGWSFKKYKLITAKADEPSDLMAANDQFKITADTTLFAVWAIDATGPGGGSDSIPDYDQLAVTYDGNGHTGGTIPVDGYLYNNGDHVTVKAHGTLVRTDAMFIGWSFGPTNLITAKADEPSDLMAANDQFLITNATTLYAVWAVDATGPGGGSDSIPDYDQLAVTYDGNGHTGGTAPVDGNVYNAGDNVTVKAHGALVRTDAMFIGWSFGKSDLVTAKADEPADLMAANDQFVINNATTLYAVWAVDATGPGGDSDSIPDYDQIAVTYDGNGNTGGAAPVDGNVYNAGDNVTVKAHGTLVRTDAMFIGWSFGPTNLITAKADEPSDLMAANDQFVISNATTLYAVWAVDATGPGGGSDSIPDYDQIAVIYDGNGHTGGTAPVDGNVYNNGDHVTVKAHGNLVRTGAVFIGWRFTETDLVTAKADEPTDLMIANDQFMITAATTLYAVWAIDVTGPGGGSDGVPDYDQLAVTYDGNGNTGGSAPVDGNVYNNGDHVTVKAHGSLARTDAVFIGWSFGPTNLITAKADEPSDLMIANDQFMITDAATLYAVWALDATGPGGGSDSIPDYDQLAVTYNGNGHTGGTAPVDGNVYNAGDNVTVKAHGTLVRTGAVFIGWSITDAALIGKDDELSVPSDLMIANDQFIITDATTLYAIWAKDGNDNGIPDYQEKTITYYWGILEGTPVEQPVAKNAPIVVADMGFRINRFVLLGWHKTMKKHMFITTAAVEQNLLSSDDFYAIGDTLIMGTNDMILYAVWAMDMNNDGYPDYPGSIIISPKDRVMEFRESESTVNEEITGAHVWTYGSTLYINTDKATRVNIYTLDGMLSKQMDVPEGLTSQFMLRGMYIVEIDGSRHKVIVK